MSRWRVGVSLKAAKGCARFGDRVGRRSCDLPHGSDMPRPAARGRAKRLATPCQAILFLSQFQMVKLQTVTVPGPRRNAVATFVLRAALPARPRSRPAEPLRMDFREPQSGRGHLILRSTRRCPRRSLTLRANCKRLAYTQKGEAPVPPHGEGYVRAEASNPGAKPQVQFSRVDRGHPYSFSRLLGRHLYRVPARSPPDLVAYRILF